MDEIKLLILDQLERLEEIILDGARIPFSGSRLVNEHEAIEILDTIRGSLPDKKSHNLSKVQRISLKLPYNINGLEEARKAIELLDFQLRNV